jgi:hypothetical protein
MGQNLFGSGVPFFVLQLSARQMHPAGQMHPTEIFVELLNVFSSDTRMKLI